MSLVFSLLFFIGCIRLSGNAYYAEQNQKTKEIETKEIGFDTRDYIPGAPTGKITIVE